MTAEEHLAIAIHMFVRRRMKLSEARALFTSWYLSKALATDVTIRQASHRIGVHRTTMIRGTKRQW
jgi:hypothetical protein